MLHFVYLLYSKSKDLFYIGISSQLLKRFEQHNSGESNFTKSGIPWKMLWHTIKTNKKEAEILERKLKNMSRDKKINLIEKYESGIDDYDLFFQIKFNRKRKNKLL